jgi:hypothetical protein
VSARESSAHQEAVKRRPRVTLTNMIGNKLLGFETVLNAMQVAIPQLQFVRQACDAFMVQAALGHRKFYELQAQITTNLYALLDENAIHPQAATQFVMDSFENYIKKTPSLDVGTIDDIRSHLEFTNDYIDYKKKLASARMPQASVLSTSKNTVFAVPVASSVSLSPPPAALSADTDDIKFSSLSLSGTKD